TVRERFERGRSNRELVRTVFSSVPLRQTLSANQATPRSGSTGLSQKRELGMAERGQGLSRSLPQRATWARTMLLAVAIAMADGTAARAADVAVRLPEAAELGTFNVGPARAVVRRMPDRVRGGPDLELEYTIPRAAARGLYAKAFPGGLGPDRADVVRLAITAANPDQARQVAVAVEIKGTAGVQRIPVEVHSQPTPTGELVDWPRIGTLTEVVVSVTPAGA